MREHGRSLGVTLESPRREEEGTDSDDTSGPGCSLIEDPRDVLIQGALQLNDSDVASISHFPTESVAHNVIWHLIKDIIADDRVFILAPLYASLIYRPDTAAELRDAVVDALCTLTRQFSRWAILVPIFRADLSDDDLGYAGHASLVTICHIGPLEGTCALHFDSLRVGDHGANLSWAKRAFEALTPVLPNPVAVDLDDVEEMPVQVEAECVYMQGLACAACLFERNKFPKTAEHIVARVVARARPRKAAAVRAQMEARYGRSKSTSCLPVEMLRAHRAFWEEEDTTDSDSVAEKMSHAHTALFSTTLSQSAASGVQSSPENSDGEGDRGYTAGEDRVVLRKDALKLLERSMAGEGSAHGHSGRRKHRSSGHSRRSALSSAASDSVSGRSHAQRRHFPAHDT